MSKVKAICMSIGELTVYYLRLPWLAALQADTSEHCQFQTMSLDCELIICIIIISVRTTKLLSLQCWEQDHFESPGELTMTLAAQLFIITMCIGLTI